MTTALPPQSDKQARHWYQINESSFVLGMRLLFWICRIFGRWPFRIVLYPVVGWYMITKRVAREASRDYLRRVSAMGAGPAIKPNTWTIMRHFAAFAETMLDPGELTTLAGQWDASEKAAFQEAVLALSRATPTQLAPGQRLLDDDN